MLDSHDVVVQALTQQQPRPRRRGNGGPPPFGWRWHRGALIPVAEEQHIRWLILHLSTEGWTLQRITDHLRDIHVHNREGQTWSRTAVHRLVSANLAATAPG